MKSNADDEKLPRLLDANFRQVRQKQIFAWWKEWTAKMRTVEEWTMRKEKQKDVRLKREYFSNLQERYEKSQATNHSKKRVELEIKRKFITVWVNRINSKRKLVLYRYQKHTGVEKPFKPYF